MDGDVLPPVGDRERARLIAYADAGGQPLQAAEAVLFEQRQQPVLGGQPGRIVAVVAEGGAWLASPYACARSFNLFSAFCRPP